MSKSFYDLLSALSDIAPLATISVDDDGQVVVHTNLSELDGVLHDMDA